MTDDLTGQENTLPTETTETDDNAPVTRREFSELLTAIKALVPPPPTTTQRLASTPKPTTPAPAPTRPAGSAMEQFAQLMIAKEMRAMQESEAARNAAAQQAAAAAIRPHVHIDSAVAAIAADENIPAHDKGARIQAAANKVLRSIRLVPAVPTPKLGPR